MNLVSFGIEKVSPLCHIFTITFQNMPKSIALNRFVIGNKTGTILWVDNLFKLKFRLRGCKQGVVSIVSTPVMGRVGFHVKG